MSHPHNHSNSILCTSFLCVFILLLNWLHHLPSSLHRDQGTVSAIPCNSSGLNAVSLSPCGVQFMTKLNAHFKLGVWLSPSFQLLDMNMPRILAMYTVEHVCIVSLFNHAWKLVIGTAVSKLPGYMNFFSSLFSITFTTFFLLWKGWAIEG